MADPPSPSESNLFENDFEKVDASSTGDLLSGGSGPAVDLYSAPVSYSSEAEPAQPSAPAPLISLDEPSPVKAAEPAAAFQPDSTQPPHHGGAGFAVCPPAPVAPPAPVKLAEAPSKPQVSGGCWFKNIDPRETGGVSQCVIDLIYWRDVKKTGVVFGSALVLLLSLALFSVLSVAAYLLLAALTVTVSFVVYKKVIHAVQKTGDGHPFKQYLDCDCAVSEDKVHEVSDIVIKRAQDTMRELRRLMLVEDLVDSLKFGLLLWVLTYIGAWFNGMTLIILAVVAVFTIPKFYETYKVQIDQYIDLARTQLKTVFKQIQEKIPLPGKKKAA